MSLWGIWLKCILFSSRSGARESVSNQLSGDYWLVLLVQDGTLSGEAQTSGHSPLCCL